MSHHDNPLHERGKALEDEYFHKRDQELIEAMRKRKPADAPDSTGKGKPKVEKSEADKGNSGTK